MCLTFQQSHIDIVNVHGDLLNCWQRFIVILYTGHLYTEIGQDFSGQARLGQHISAGWRKVEICAIKSGVERVMYSAIPWGGNHIRLLSLRSTHFILRALRREAVELASRTEAARCVICPQLRVRVTLVFCEDENIHYVSQCKECNALLLHTTRPCRTI